MTNKKEKQQIGELHTLIFSKIRLIIFLWVILGAVKGVIFDVVFGTVPIFLLTFPLLAMLTAIVIISYLTKKKYAELLEEIKTNLGDKYFDC